MSNLKGSLPIICKETQFIKNQKIQIKQEEPPSLRLVKTKTKRLNDANCWQGHKAKSTFTYPGSTEDLHVP